ncbi:MAG: hypothetical protein NZ551_00550 [Microscillaceae bacterium]|nr:hypothetical protein [Microscillaceae bacterium]MDW8459677.1 hypothetical protein [Cytophagales bacterium]
MLEYVKTVLEKVSFDLFLFEKELKKAIRLYLSPQEVDLLREWCFANYSHSNHFLTVLEQVFRLELKEN